MGESGRPEESHGKASATTRPPTEGRWSGCFSWWWEEVEGKRAPGVGRGGRAKVAPPARRRLKPQFVCEAKALVSPQRLQPVAVLQQQGAATVEPDDGRQLDRGLTRLDQAWTTLLA